MKIAFICDWLTGMRGGERCLEAMCEVYPQADIYTLVYYPEKFNGQFDTHKITTSFIQKLPGNDNSFRRYLPLFPKAIESFDLSGYDCVISFSHCVAKSAIVPNNIPHICYCYSPVRYAWDMKKSYLASIPKLKRPIINLILNRLRKWDFKTAVRPDYYIAISNYIQQRIKCNYGLDSSVIYPPVECSRFSVSTQDDGYYLALSALVPYKRIDIAVNAFSKIGSKLIVVGRGSELEKLKAMAASNIEFVSDASDEQVTEFLSKTKALIFPGEEDFGIVPLEAQACGKPVIAFGKGGALETVKGLDECQSDNATGIFFHDQNVESLINAIKQFEARKGTISPESCRENAERFGRNRYKQEMGAVIEKVIDENSAK